MSQFRKLLFKVDWVGLAYWFIMLLSTVFVLLCLMGGLSGCQTTVTRFQCPPLAPPTSKVVTALEQVGSKDPSSGAWVVDLEKHYEKCEALAKLQ